MPNTENTEAKQQYNNELVPLSKILEVIKDRDTWDLKKSIEGAYIIQEMSRQA